MTTFLQRLRRPFERRAHQTNLVALSLDFQHAEEQRLNDYNGHSGRGVLSTNSSRSPLPVLTDPGSPTAYTHENRDIYWNSMMVEADDDTHPKRVHKKKYRRENSHLHLLDVTNLDHVRDIDNLRCRDHMDDGENAHHSVQQHNKGARQSRQNPHGSLERTIAQHTATLASPSAFQTSHREQSSPSHKSIHMNEDTCTIQYRNASSPSARDETVVTATSQTAALANPLFLDTNQESSPSPAFIFQSDYPSNNNPTDSLPQNGGLTWNIALNQILDSGYVDPQIKHALQERINNNSTVNGTENDERVVVSPIAAGLVPNFSYPIAASAFYDRNAVDQIRRPSIDNDLGDEESTNDVDVHKPLTNGVISDEPDSRCSTGSTGSQPYSITPSVEPSDRICFLLSSLLTPSELALHYHAVNRTLHTQSTASSVASPALNTSLWTSKHEQLVQKLHFALLGLQDRVMGLEDSLIPQLSTWLEQKSHSIDVLSVEVSSLQAEVNGLKVTVDFGNKVLAGCWTREAEMWRTLASLRWEREKKNTRLRRWTKCSSYTQGSKEHGAEVSERYERQHNCSNGLAAPDQKGVVSHSQKEESTTSQQRHTYPQVARESEKSETLSRKDLDALLTMAALNVRTLKEDMEDMIVLVKECKRRTTRTCEVERAEGSWRDV